MFEADQNVAASNDNKEEGCVPFSSKQCRCCRDCINLSRSSGLAKTVLRGTVKGGRRRGRQKQKWEDNIKEWTGLVFAKSQGAVENREKWKKLVVK